MSADERRLLLDLGEPDAGVVGTLAALDGDLILLGAGGKIGHGLALMARRGFEQAGRGGRVIAVSRFSDPAARSAMDADGIHTIACDLSDPGAVAGLPEAPALVFLAGQKFGTGRAAALTWLLNTFVPAVVARRWPRSRFAVYSSGNVYPFTPPDSGGATEAQAPDPVGEYAQSVLGRERIFEHHALANGTPVAIIRLNYAVEPRYGVLVDIAGRILAGAPVDLSNGHVNVVWQGDCNRVTLRCLDLAASPASILNLAGPLVSVRDLAGRLGRALGIEARLTGTPGPTALLSNASRCWEQFGPPRVGLDQMIERVVAWLRAGGTVWDKPTHFEVRDGRF